MKIARNIPNLSLSSFILSARPFLLFLVLTFTMMMSTYAFSTVGRNAKSRIHRLCLKSPRMFSSMTRTSPLFSSPPLSPTGAISSREDVLDATSQFPVVTLAKGKARLFQDGNPIIYGGAVDKIAGEPAIGAEVVVQDSNGNRLGRGIFNPISTYRVRLLARSYESIYSAPLSEILKTRLTQAVELRKHLQLPTEESNTVYRLGNLSLLAI